jgi:hypothetical protein
MPCGVTLRRPGAALPCGDGDFVDVVPTVVTASGMTSSWGNSVKNALDQGGLYRKRARMSRTVTTAIGNTVNATIANVNPVYTDTVLFDNDAMCFGGYMNINTPGYWWLHSTAEWLTTGTTGLRITSIYELTSDRHLAPCVRYPYNAAGSTYNFSHWFGYLGTDAVIQMRVAQSSGASASFYTAWWGLSLSAFLVAG